jgi:hypothetical protein
MAPNSDALALIERSSNFTIALLSRKERWENEGRHFSVHDTVLRPLLAMADECWAYGVQENSEVFLAAKTILSKEGRRHRVLLVGDPVTGHELFWNAYGGKRGTIAISIPAEKFDADKVFPHCLRTIVVTNYRAGHNPAAISYAQRKIDDGTHVVVCLPRNNGMEWAEIFAPKPLVFSLFAKAQALCSDGGA